MALVEERCQLWACCRSVRIESFSIITARYKLVVFFVFFLNILHYCSLYSAVTIRYYSNSSSNPEGALWPRLQASQWVVHALCWPMCGTCVTWPPLGCSRQTRRTDRQTGGNQDTTTQPTAIYEVGLIVLGCCCCGFKRLTMAMPWRFFEPSFTPLVQSIVLY